MNDDPEVNDDPQWEVHFAGMTGPGASGGAMAFAYVVTVGGKPVRSGAEFRGDDGWCSPDASWHTATYEALSFAVLREGNAITNGAPLCTDDEMVVKQMQGLRGVKDGHYIGAREAAIKGLSRWLQQKPTFKWIPYPRNRAVYLCHDLFEAQGIEPWSYKNKSLEHDDAPIPFIAGGARTTWADLKARAVTRQAIFTVDRDTNKLVFHLGPDIFPGSFRLAWTTPEERAGGPFLDRRVRSNEPDDFLSRIRSLVRMRSPLLAKPYDGKT